VVKQDILTLREKAAMEQNPATRADLARQVLAQIGEAVLPSAKAIETEVVNPEPVGSENPTPD
jgi:hypothetical protein